MNLSIIQGYLYKESRTFKTRKKRWMVLKGHHLHAYKNEKSTKTKPTESFDLSKYYKLKVCTKDKFELYSDTDRRAFIAPNPDILTEWIKRIGEVQKEYKPKVKSDDDDSIWECIECGYINNDLSDDQCVSCKKPRLISATTQSEIIEQLKKFGYNEKEILNAINDSIDKLNINDVLKLIKQKQQREHTKTLTKKMEKSVSPQLTLKEEDDNKSIDWKYRFKSYRFKSLKSLEPSQQTIILQKIKIICNKLLVHNFENEDFLYLDYREMTSDILMFDNGLQCLHDFGFEQHSYSSNLLICKKANLDTIKACIHCIEQNKDVDTLSGTDFDPFIRLDQLSDSEQNKMLWDEYIDRYGKPKRAEQFILWAKKRGKVIKFKDANNFIKRQGLILMDMHSNDKKENEQNKAIKKKKKEKMKGPKRQFYKFLAEHRLEKYFDKFEEMNCCNIADVEYLDDDNFLKKEIGINHPIERRRLIGESKKFKKRMDAFKEIEVSPFLRHKLDSLGIVTRGILSKEARSKLELRAKFGLNDEQSDLLWNVIENKHVSRPKLKLKRSHMSSYMEEDYEKTDEEEGTQQEGMDNVAAVDVNVIDTMHGYMIKNDADTAYI